MARRYASRTTVPVGRSKADIEKLLAKHGASQFVSGYNEEFAVVGFSIDDRQVQIKLPLPDEDDYNTTKQFEQEQRRVWRALLLLIKAKLEAIAAEVSTIEREFMADLMLPNGQRLGDWASPQIESAYASGKMPKLLPGG